MVGKDNFESEKRRIEAIAKICHDANRAYCQTIDDNSQLPWEQALDWQKASVIDGVKFHMANPTAGASASHDNWMKQKIKDGWVFGPIKDGSKKEHPCLVSFYRLPREQQVKDHLFRSIVHALDR